MNNSRMQSGTFPKVQGQLPAGCGEPWPLLNSTFHQNQHNIGTALARRLEQIGALDYFVVPGETRLNPKALTHLTGYSRLFSAQSDFNLTLLDQLLKNKALRMVGCCNELNSGYAADGYARSSPLGVAVVVVTFMVGGLSALNAIAGAYSERLKVIIVSGCPSEASFGQDRLIHRSLGVKDRDQPLRIFREVTTASVRLNTKEDPVDLLDTTISKCLRDSLPVYIEIPANLSTLPCRTPGPQLIQDPDLPLRLSGKEKLTPALDAFIDTWKAAQRPVLMIGSLARRVVSPDMLLAFVEKLGCAVFCLPDGKSLVPETHPQFAETFWCSASTSTCEKAVLESDLWVILGGRWTDLHTFGKIDIERESHRIVDMQDGVITTPGGRAIRDIPLDELVSALLASDIPRNDTTQWSVRCLPDLVNGDDFLNKNAPLSVPGILHGIQNMLRPNDTLIAESGDSWFNAQRIRLPQGADFHIQVMYGSIGWSLPATLGCQLARPDGRTVLMIGDGSFQMAAQELSTMIRMRSNSIIFIFNNLGYQIETAIHDGPYNYFNNWDYASFARALCIANHTIDKQNPFLCRETYSDPHMLTFQIKCTEDLLMALDRVELEPSMLAVLDCCIHPRDYSPSLQQFCATLC